jgi:hypothetical protein
MLNGSKRSQQPTHPMQQLRIGQDSNHHQQAPSNVTGTQNSSKRKLPQDSCAKAPLMLNGSKRSQQPTHPMQQLRILNENRQFMTRMFDTDV